MFITINIYLLCIIIHNNLGNYIAWLNKITFFNFNNYTYLLNIAKAVWVGMHVYVCVGMREEGRENFEDVNNFWCKGYYWTFLKTYLKEKNRTFNGKMTSQQTTKIKILNLIWNLIRICVFILSLSNCLWFILYLIFYIYLIKNRSGYYWSDNHTAYIMWIISVSWGFGICGYFL